MKAIIHKFLMEREIAFLRLVILFLSCAFRVQINPFVLKVLFFGFYDGMFLKLIFSYA